jgi:hypothetical protein
VSFADIAQISRKQFDAGKTAKNSAVAVVGTAVVAGFLIYSVAPLMILFTRPSI